MSFLTMLVEQGSAAGQEPRDLHNTFLMATKENKLQRGVVSWVMSGRLFI